MSLASLVRWCDSKMGLRYSTDYSRFGYSSPEHYDCSGFVWRGCHDNGYSLDASVSWTIQLEGEAKRLTCSRQYAMTHICIAVHGGNTEAGGGPNGHVCFTDGRGGTWEAMGKRYGLRKGLISNRFEYFMRLPGGPPPGPTPEQLAALAAEIERRRKIGLEMIRRAVLRAQEGDEGMVTHVLYNGMTNVFSRNNDGRLYQLWWDKPKGIWQTGDPNAAAGHPEIRIAPESNIVSRTRQLHGTENEVDLYYETPEGDVGHTWFNSPAWGAEVLRTT